MRKILIFGALGGVLLLTLAFLFRKEFLKAARPFIQPNFVFMKPMWKANLRAHLLTTLAETQSSYFPQCYECELQECRVSLEGAIDKCFAEYDAEIPYVVLLEGESLGGKIGSCAENKFQEIHGKLLPSPACDTALVELYKSIGNSADPRIFAPFIARFETFGEILKREPAKLKEIQEAYQAFAASDLTALVKITRALEGPYVKRAALESKNKEAIEEHFENTLSLMNSSEWAKIIGLGQSFQGGDSVKPDSLKGVKSSDNKSSKATLIRGLDSLLEKPYTPDQLESLADPILTTLPLESLKIIEENPEEANGLCALMLGVGQAYPSWKEEDKEIIARFFVHSMAE